MSITWLCLNCRIQVFNIHSLCKYMVHNLKLSWSIIFIFSHNRILRLVKSLTRLCIYLTDLVLHSFSFFISFRTFFEKNFSQNLFSFITCFIIFNIIEMRLIKYTCRVVIAVRIFVPNTTHLIHNLCLSCSRTYCKTLLSRQRRRSHLALSYLRILERRLVLTIRVLLSKILSC